MDQRTKRSFPSVSGLAVALACLGSCATPASEDPNPGGGGGGAPSAGSGGKGTGGAGGKKAPGGKGGAASGGESGTADASANPDPADMAAASDAGTGEAGGPPTDPEGPVPTDLTKHRYSKVLTMDTTATGASVAASIPKYPVAVTLTEMNFDFSQAKGAGEDLRFATMEGTLLPHAIESWDAAGKQAAVWVKVDVKGNDKAQSFVMHWGNPAAESGSRSKALFSMEDGYLGVYHLNENGSNEPNAYKDSSANGADGTGRNMEPGSTAPARIGRGVLLNNPGGQGKNQWIGMEGPKVNEAFNATAAHPISATAWAWGNSYSGYYETIFSKGDTSWTLQRDYQGRTETCTWSGSYHSCAITGAPPVKKWTHYMIVQTTSNLTLFVNGKRAASAGSFGKTGIHGFAISHNMQSEKDELKGKREWDGIIDEARVMSVAKDANWALLDYESQREGSKFLTFGATQMK